MLLLSAAVFSYPDGFYSWRNGYFQHYCAVKNDCSLHFWDYSGVCHWKGGLVEARQRFLGYLNLS